MPETIKLLGSIKNKITKDKNGKNVPHSEITEVILVYCNIVTSVYQQDSVVLYKFVPNKPSGQLLDISHNYFKLFFKKLLRQTFRILKYGLLVKILNL